MIEMTVLWWATDLWVESGVNTERRCILYSGEIAVSFSLYMTCARSLNTRYASYLQLIDHFSSAPYYRIDIHSSQISNYYNYYCYWMLHLQPGLASSKAFIFHSAHQLIQSVRLHHIHQPLVVSEISRVFSSIYIPF